MRWRTVVLVVTFEEDAGEDGVDLPDVGEVHVVDERGEQEVEMFPTNRASVDIVVWCDIKVVIDFRFHFAQKVKRVIFRYLWDFCTRFADFKDIEVV